MSLPTAMSFLAPFLFAALLVAAVGCGGDDEGDDGGGGSGSGMLTIGDESWDITGIACASSVAEVEGSEIPPPGNVWGYGESSAGNRAMLTAYSFDPSGQGRIEGDGIVYGIAFKDIDDPQNPTIDWSTLPHDALSQGREAVFSIDGRSVHGEGVFDDLTTDVNEMVPGKFDGECP